jgi:hypothetical protein
MTTVLILGRTEDGDTDPYYLIHSGETEPAPPVGGRCRVWYRRTNLEIVGGLAITPGLPGSVFENFDCMPAANPEAAADEGSPLPARRGDEPQAAPHGLSETSLAPAQG